MGQPANIERQAYNTAGSLDSNLIIKSPIFIASIVVTF